MKENKVEQALSKRIKKQGGIPYKFVSPGRNDVPDRLCLLPIVDMYHRAIVNNYVRFVECKAPGKKPRTSQIREHNRLKKLGFNVEILDDI